MQGLDLAEKVMASRRDVKNFFSFLETQIITVSWKCQNINGFHMHISHNEMLQENINS